MSASSLPLDHLLSGSPPLHPACLERRDIWSWQPVAAALRNFYCSVGCILLSELLGWTDSYHHKAAVAGGGAGLCEHAAGTCLLAACPGGTLALSWLLCASVKHLLQLPMLLMHVQVLQLIWWLPKTSVRVAVAAARRIAYSQALQVRALPLMSICWQPCERGGACSKALYRFVAVTLVLILNLCNITTRLVAG